MKSIHESNDDDDDDNTRQFEETFIFPLEFSGNRTGRRQSKTKEIESEMKSKGFLFFCAWNLSQKNVYKKFSNTTAMLFLPSHNCKPRWCFKILSVPKFKCGEKH